MEDVAIGIDMGSAVSSMAWATPEGQVQIICNAEGDPTTPAVIDFGQSPPIVGKQAWTRRFAGDPQVITLFRRLIDEDLVLTSGDRTWSGVEMHALLLSKLRNDAETALQRPVTRAVITIPAYLMNRSRDAVIQAARRAGLQVTALLPEPVAVILAYIHRHHLTDGLYVVYDLSAATFDVSLIKLVGNEVSILAIAGDNCLGTIDWTHRIAAWISDNASALGLPSIRHDADFLAKVQQIAELLNASMRTRSEATFSLDGRTDLRFSREQFEQLTTDILSKTVFLCEDMLRKAGVDWNQVDGVILAGEAGRIPAIQDFVTRLSGKAAVPVVEEAIAVGAALKAIQVDFDIAGPHMDDSKSLLLELPALGTPLTVVDTLVVNQGSSLARIEFCVGDLTAIEAKDAVDVLIVSAFPNNYPPLPGSLIGALARKGLSVEELARRKEVDLRQSFSCWMSPLLKDLRQGLHFARILCFEPYCRGTPAELVGDIFRSLAPFFGGHPPIRTVATPIPATGYQGVDPVKMLRLLVEAAVQWMAVGMPLARLKIVCLPGPNVEALQNAFQDLKRTCTPQVQHSDHDFKYDLFISYAHADQNEVSIFERKLIDALPSIRMFIDRKDLNPGAAWQHEIYQSLDECRKVLAFLTPAYLGSKVCLEEFNIALCRNREASRRILAPVYLYSAQLPTYMKVVQFWDCREFERARIDQVCVALTQELSVEKCS